MTNNPDVGDVVSLSAYRQRRYGDDSTIDTVIDTIDDIVDGVDMEVEFIVNDTSVHIKSAPEIDFDTLKRECIDDEVYFEPQPLANYIEIVHTQFGDLLTLADLHDISIFYIHLDERSRTRVKRFAVIGGYHLLEYFRRRDGSAAIVQINPLGGSTDSGSIV